MLDSLRGLGVFDTLDVMLARTLGRRVGEEGPLAHVTVALASRAVQDGHVCVDLGALAGQPIRDRDSQALEGRVWPPLEHWLQALNESALVSGGERLTPLVRIGSRVYLQRYHQHEVELANALLSRAHPLAVDAERLLPLLDRFARPSALEEGTPDWQRVACALAAGSGLLLITGGPGTGKTTVVSRMLAVLGKLARDAGQPFHPLLLAPTGKAAARLDQSLRDQQTALPADLQPPESYPVRTIHSAMGVIAGPQQRFRHGPDRPLPADLVLVDEASMVDLSLMRRMVDAVPPSARLVLLGDPGQLVSVESGAVLGELVRAGTSRSKAGHQRLEALSGEALPSPEGAGAPLGDVSVELQHSFRFAKKPGIGALATALRGGHGERAVSVLEDPRFTEVQLTPRPKPRTLGSLVPGLIERFDSLLGCQEPRAALMALDHFRILCAHRRGPHGLEMLTPLVERALASDGRLRPNDGHYRGRPILITRNDYDQKLFNGDQGVLMPDPEDTSNKPRLWAWFNAAPGPAGEQQLRRLSPSRLPPHETAWVLTIHKAQGSELDNIWVWMPPSNSPLANRELLYTAVTRAKKSVTLLSTPLEVRTAASRSATRWSGLAQALGADVRYP